MRSKLTALSGALGVGLLLAGALLRLTQPGGGRYWSWFLIGGLVAVAIYVVSHWRSLSSLAGARAAREGANAVVLSIVVLGIVVAINYIANRHATQWDLTAARQFTLSEQTLNILSGLETDIAIVLLDDPTSAPAIEARDLLELYDLASPRVSAEVVDPDAEPERALAYQSPTEPGIALGTVIVEAGERRERTTAPTEPEITSAILRTQREASKKIYFTSGHGEKELTDTGGERGISVIQTKLEESAYEIATVVMARSSADEALLVPGDADALVVAGPRVDFSPEEIAALRVYLGEGGSALFLLDPTQEASTPNLADFLLELGVLVGDDVVVDRFAVPPVVPVVSDYGAHPIVESFARVRSMFPFARTVSRDEDVPEGAEVRELFTTPDAESWAETRLEELSERGGPAPDQKVGPLSLAVAASVPGAVLTGAEGAGEAEGETEDEAPRARVVVVGDSDFITNDLAQAPVLNANLFLNMVNWSTQDEDLMGIRPREPEDRRVFLSPQQRANVILLSLLVVPGVLLVTGISVWWGRR